MPVRDEPYTVRGHTLQELYDEDGRFIGFTKPLIWPDNNRLPRLENPRGPFRCAGCDKHFTASEMYHHSCKGG